MPERYYQYFDDFGLAYYLEIVTFTTVGYGDGYPASIPGRIINTLLCISGLIWIAVCVRIAMYRVAFSP